uniref:Reticulon 4 interacting protein 1 n=1 Tax=Fundulus heteroclitus TaxID=8078 RepID=A0A3Q2P3T0_FUNHE
YTDCLRWRSCLCIKRNFMPAWVIDKYGNNDVLRFTNNASFPVINYPNEVIVKVFAAGLNPLDVSMRGGYGSATLAMKRDPLNIMQSGNEFPLVLGRDVSGVVMECGLDVKYFRERDEVWAAIPPWKQGSLAEFVVLSANEISHKPKSMSHTEAAAIPYVATTAWSALVNTGGLSKDNSPRVWLPHLLAGVSVFMAILVWTVPVAMAALRNAGRFHGFRARVRETWTLRFDLRWALGLLKPWTRAKYMTLLTPFLLNTDQMSIADSMLQTAATVATKAIKHLVKGVHYRWGFFAPSGPALDEIREMVDAGQIRAVVEETFSFSQVPQAFEKVEKGHARGKTVVEIKSKENQKEGQK